ncbi:MAG: DUF5693 family protein [Synergistaceae bacterium]|nr:DUF5693 family protein [Synergistaceae bacterium]
MIDDLEKNEDSGMEPENVNDGAETPRNRALRKFGFHSRIPDRAPLTGKILDFARLFWILLLLAVIMSGFDLFSRIRIERNHRVVGIIAEYRDIVLLSRQTGESVGDTWNRVRETGIVGVCASELTGKDLAAGFLPVYYGSLATFRPILRFAMALPLDRAAILVENSEPLFETIVDYLRIRYRGVVTLSMAEGTLIVLPQATDELADAGIIPDFAALSFAEKAGARVVYRPQSAPGVDGEHTAASMEWIKKNYPSISCMLPAGQIVSGYPDLAPLIGTLKELKIPVAQAEFVRQIGVSELYSGMVPSVIPLHSLVREELISRRYSREQVIERMIRAVHERSIRLLLLRPYELYSVGKLVPFIEDTRTIGRSLESRGYMLGWPETIPMKNPSPGSAVGVALVFLTCVWSYARRFYGYGGEVSGAETAVVLLCGAALGFCAWKVSVVSRMLGGLTAAMIAAEATLWALDAYEKPIYGLLAGLLVTVAGGIAIASFYGTTRAMLRLTPFSGVKLTLLLPPVLIVLNDLKLRIHPESLPDILRRPPIWGELALVGCALCAAVILTVRSDNASFVPGWEVRFRDFLERLMWVRPRTKEFLVGYPCMIVYFVAERKGWFENYREVFRLGASMAFASAVNSFCHFHTILILSALRVVNGWLLGIAAGFIILVAMDYVGRPLWEKLTRLFA